MERRKEQEESAAKPPATPTRRGKRSLSLVRKTVYTLDELPQLYEQWRREEPDPKEIARRTRLFERAARVRAELADRDIPVDELLRRAREELTGG